MKRFALLVLTLSVVLIFAACAKADMSDTSVTSDTSGHAEVLSESQAFASLEEFENHEKTTGVKAVSHYYTPSALPSDYRLSRVTKRDDAYIMLEYTAPADKVTSSEKLSEYDAERLNTLICRYSPYSDGEKALEESFISKGYKPVELNGKVYYRADEHAEGNADKQIIGYELAFLEDGKLIYMHLPAVDSFENMIKYAYLDKVDIK